MVRISIFVCSTTTPFNTANDYSESAKGNLPCNSNLVLTECPSKNTRLYLLGAPAFLGNDTDDQVCSYKKYPNKEFPSRFWNDSSKMG